MIGLLAKLQMRGWQALRVKFHLQRKLILLIAASMSLILFTSSYLHTVRTRTVMTKDHYENAIGQTLALASRIAESDYFSDLGELQQGMQLVAGSRPDFMQIDIYQNSLTGPQLLATTAADRPRLSSLNGSVKSATIQPLCSDP